MAFVILHPQRASQWKGKHDAFEEELKKHARTRLPGFACPEWVSVVEDLPVSVDFALRSTRFDSVSLENLDGQDTEDGSAKGGGKAVNTSA